MPSRLVEEMRAYMEREGRLTQGEFAERTKPFDPNGKGIAQSTISRILNETQSPTIDILDKLAKVMGRDVMDLAYWQLGREPMMSTDIVEHIRHEVAQLGDQYQIVADIFFLCLRNLSNRERLETVAIILKQPNKQPGEFEAGQG